LAPFRESGYRILMEAFERSGNVAEALRVYDRLRVTLRDELGIPPSSAVQDVYRRMLGESNTTAQISPARASTSSRETFPTRSGGSAATCAWAFVHSSSSSLPSMTLPHTQVIRLIPVILCTTSSSCPGRLRHQAQLHEQGDLVVVDLAADDSTVDVEMPHLAERQRP